MVYSLLGAILVVALVAVILLATKGDGDGGTGPSGRQPSTPAPAPKESTPDGAAQAPDDPAGSLAGESSGESGTGSPTAGEPEEPETGEPGPEKGAGGQPDIPSRAGEQPEEEDVSAQQRKAKMQRYLGIAPLAPLPGTSDTEKQKLQKLIEDVADPYAGAAANRAIDDLAEIGKPAVPYLINAFLDVDLESADMDSINSGAQIHEALGQVTGRNLFYNRMDESEQGIMERLKTRYSWHRWWTRNKDTWEPPRRKG